MKKSVKGNKTATKGGVSAFLLSILYLKFEKTLFFKIYIITWIAPNFFFCEIYNQFIYSGYYILCF